MIIEKYGGDCSLMTGTEGDRKGAPLLYNNACFTRYSCIVMLTFMVTLIFLYAIIDGHERLYQYMPILSRLSLERAIS